jgi:photosystem II stability/assembly factor-like uncharacterized protein
MRASSCFAVLALGALPLCGCSGPAPLLWTNLSRASTQGELFTGLWGRGTELYAVGLGGVVERSRDRGQTWEPRQVDPINGAPPLLWAVAGGQTRLFAVGEAGTILRSDDDGDSWKPLPSPTSATLYALWVTDDDTVVAVGDGGTIVTTVDGGASWKAPSSGTALTFWSLVHRSDGEYVAVGGGESTPMFSPAQGIVARSSDAGATWTSTVVAADQLGGVDGVSGQMFAAGYGGEMLVSADGGGSWAALTSGVTVGLGRVRVGADGRVVAAGGIDGLGTIIESSDVSHGFAIDFCPGGSGVIDLWRSDDGVYFALADDGTLSRGE